MPMTNIRAHQAHTAESRLCTGSGDIARDAEGRYKLFRNETIDEAKLAGRNEYKRWERVMRLIEINRKYKHV